jgi:hypothetical protein
VGVIGLAATWPFLEAGPRLLEGLDTYARHWSFNGSIHPLVQGLLGEYARPVLLVVAAAVVGHAIWRRTDPAEVALIAGGTFVLLSPTVHPWYVAWAWVPALICGVRAWTLLAALMPLAYIVLTTLDPITGQWQEHWWPAVVIYVPFFGLLCTDTIRGLTRPGPYPSPSTTP